MIQFSEIARQFHIEALRTKIYYAAKFERDNEYHTKWLKTALVDLATLLPLAEKYPQFFTPESFRLSRLTHDLNITLVCKELRDLTALLLEVEEYKPCQDTLDTEQGRMFTYSNLTIQALVNWSDSTCRLVTETETITSSREVRTHRVVCK